VEVSKVAREVEVIVVLLLLPMLLLLLQARLPDQRMLGSRAQIIEAVDAVVIGDFIHILDEPKWIDWNLLSLLGGSSLMACGWELCHCLWNQKSLAVGLMSLYDFLDLYYQCIAKAGATGQVDMV